MGIEFSKLRCVRNTFLSGLNLFKWKKSEIYQKIQENFSQKIHVYECFSQNQKFLQLNTVVQPVKEHDIRKRKIFQIDLNLRFFTITAKRNKNKINFYFLRLVNFCERCSAFLSFIFSSKRFRTLAFTFWIVMLLKNAITIRSIFWIPSPLKVVFIHEN